MTDGLKNMFGKGIERQSWRALGLNLDKRNYNGKEQKSASETRSYYGV